MVALVCCTLAVSAVLVAIAVFACDARRPVRIGVMLPLSGPNDAEPDEVLRWAAGELNARGGVGGREIELVFRDIASKNADTVAGEMLEDESINVVIGPRSSVDAFRLAPRFIEERKLLISPTATSDDLFRASGKKGFFWRTCQSDVAQVRTIVQVLTSRKAKRVSLIYEDSIYGKTFSDWMGFFCIEQGIELSDIVKLEPEGAGRDTAMARALRGDPEYVVCAVFPEDAVVLKRELDAAGSDARIMLTDAAEKQYTLDEMGTSAEGVELVAPAARPDSGFEAAYKAEFGHLPLDSAAPTYDAFLLAVYAVARDQQMHGRVGLDESLADVVAGTGEVMGWDQAGGAVDEILAGRLPDIEGASGSLRFDSVFGVDPLQTYYALKRVAVENGVRGFRTIDVIDSDESRGFGALVDGGSAGRARASGELVQVDSRTRAAAVVGARKDAWAVVVSTSRGWENYRHQADALSVYRLLRDNGFDDEHIILFVADDIAAAPENPEKGRVRASPGGQELRSGARIDYAGEDVTVSNLEAVLLGKKSGGTPQVLGSDRNSNVFMFLVDHGEPGGVLFELDAKEPVMRSERLGDIVERMRTEGRYRQMFLVTEVCFGESVVASVESSGVACLTGAAAGERSFATNYDPRSGAWMADDFTTQFLSVLRENPDATVAGLYAGVYERVTGSHVRLLPRKGFGDVYSTPMNDFVRP